jgi:hypothetical protein
MTDSHDTTLAALPAAWRAEADRLERFAPPAALAFRDAALQLEQALRSAESEELTLAEAALASGFSAEHLRKLVASGTVPNAGRRGAPRIRRGDLPKKASPAISAGYDPNADALRLASGGRR